MSTIDRDAKIHFILTANKTPQDKLDEGRKNFKTMADDDIDRLYQSFLAQAAHEDGVEEMPRGMMTGKSIFNHR